MLDIKDRGHAKYFHGRIVERATFVRELESARQEQAGTTFLIQGPPGAGKTALLAECTKLANKAGWHTARIDPLSLYDPVRMAQRVGGVYISRRERVTGFDAKLAEKQWIKELAGTASASDVLKDLASDRGLLLILDEVQHIREFIDGPHKMAAMSTLDAIHNGELGRPVILLAGGLGPSEDAFARLGISRFMSDCIVNLGRLSPEAEHAVIQDWLVKDGQARSGPHLEHWIKAIAAESDRWPQHIVAFAQPASQVAAREGGRLTAQGLEEATRWGQQAKTKYYEGRVAPFGKAVRVALANLARHGGSHSKYDLLNAFTNIPGENSVEVFARAVEKGVLAQAADGDYTFSVPSLQAWLVEHYG